MREIVRREGIESPPCRRRCSRMPSALTGPKPPDDHVWRSWTIAAAEGLRCLRRGALRTSGALVTPLGLGALIAMLPFIQPTFGTAYLPAHHLNRLTRSVALKRLLTASLQGTRRTARFPLRMFSFRMTLCSRCHGTTPRGRLSPSSGLGRLRAWLTRCASSLRWAGGFRWR
jgi:hypothetical protein